RISGSLGFRWVAFECAPVPVASATEIHRSEKRTIVPVSETATCFGATSGRHTNTATPTVTPSTSLNHGESDITDYEHNASNQTHQARGTEGSRNSIQDQSCHQAKQIVPRGSVLGSRV